jgi:hypothetical protein
MSPLGSRAILLLLALVTPSLAQDAPPPPPAPVRPEPADPTVQRLELAYLRRKTDEARRWFQDGRWQEVIDRCTALLDLEPDLPWKDDVKALRVRARERAQAADVLEAALIPESAVVVLGDPIRLRLRLTARAEDPLEWWLHEPGAEASAHAVCDVQVREHGLGRVEAFETFRVTIAGLPAEAVLPRGNAIEARLEIPTHDYAPLRPTPRAYRCIATVRPQRLVAGARAWHRQVLVPSADVVVLPRGCAAIAADPVAAMRAAVHEEWPFRCTAAAFAAGPAQRAATAEVLLDALGGGFERSAMWSAVYGALRHLTGEELPDQRAAWLGYWTRVRSQAAAGASAPAGDR